MVVDDFHIVSVSFMPAKADAVLIVYPDAVLPLAVAGEFLQAVAGRGAEVVQGLSRVQKQQLPQRRRGSHH